MTGSEKTNVASPGAAAAALPPRPAKTGGKLYIKTQGCQMNVYDSARMADLLAAEHGL
jgi:tRNA-2-methylthio-N6-dimethylallyladenosine synthase